MKPEEYFCVGVMWLVPISFGMWWVLARLGLDKRWFVVPAAPLVSRNFYFALPTIVLGFISGLTGASLGYPDYRDDNIVVGYFLNMTFIFWGMSFIFAYLEPDWMSPAWYRWLKHEHGDILPYLAQEAHEMGRQEWLARVQTQEDLEQWVAEVRRKHGL